MKRFLQQALGLVGSFGFVCILLLLLLLLTFLGTMAQVEHGLYEAQKTYFDSFYVVIRLFDVVPVLLPGAYLVMILLAIGLVAGGLVRMRRSWSLVGVYVAHVGILMLLAAGWVKQQFAVEGHMTLREGQRSAEFRSYHDWEIALFRAPQPGVPTTEYLIDEDAFDHLDRGARRTFQAAALPFDFTVDRYFRNSQVLSAGDPRSAADGPVVDGFFLRPLPRAKEAEQNLPGVYVTLTDKQSGRQRPAILWAGGFFLNGRTQPLPVAAAEGFWGVELRHWRENLPFAVQLEDFRVAFHPGTGTPASFESDVTFTEGGVARPVCISMNEPLRHQGWTLYQSSWGPQGGSPDSPDLYSDFAVSNNPSDQWPLWSCVVITAGLFLHFALKLLRHVRAQQRRLATA